MGSIPIVASLAVAFSNAGRDMGPRAVCAHMGASVNFFPWLQSGQGVTSDQILNAAASASLASPDEWADLVGSQNLRPNDTVATGTSPPVVPVDTKPAFVDGPRDVTIFVTVDDVSANEQRWSGVLPSGESWSAKITRVYDRMDIRYSIDGNLTESSFGTSTAQATGDGQVTCCNPMAITKNPKAVALRVLRPNGDRYTIPLHELPGMDDVRIALIAMTRQPTAQRIDRRGWQGPRVLRASLAGRSATVTCACQRLDRWARSGPYAHFGASAHVG